MNWQPGVTGGDPEELEDPNVALAAEDVGFTGPDVETDETAIIEDSRQALRERAPGWERHDGNLDDWLIEAFGQTAAELRTLIAQVPEALFVTYGEQVLSIPIRVPVPAIGFSTWVASDTAGYTVQAGEHLTLPGIVSPGSELVEFETVHAAAIPPGQTSVANVEIRAVEPGVQGNGLSGRAELQEPPTWLDHISVPAHTYGGDDGQDEAAYLDELSQLLRMVALRPVLPMDYAILARRIPGVGRAVAMDLYDPATDTWDNERTITLVLTDAYGEPVAEGVAERVKEVLDELREVNVLIHVIAPTYTEVSVTYEVTAFAEQDAEIVKELADAAVRTYLSPQNYRLGTTSPSIAAGEVVPPPQEGNPPGQQVIRVNELVAQLDRVRGVDWVDSVQINGGSANVTLLGPTTLPRAGAVTGTVNVQ